MQEAGSSFHASRRRVQQIPAVIDVAICKSCLACALQDALEPGWPEVPAGVWPIPNRDPPVGAHAGANRSRPVRGRSGTCPRPARHAAAPTRPGPHAAYVPLPGPGLPPDRCAWPRRQGPPGVGGARGGGKVVPATPVGVAGKMVVVPWPGFWSNPAGGVPGYFFPCSALACWAASVLLKARSFCATYSL